MRIVFIQNGDYRETVQRFAQGGGEMYYAQRYSVDFVSDLLQRNEIERVTVLCVRANPTYKEELLDNGVYALGVDVGRGGRGVDDPIIEAMERINPTHLVLRTPRPTLLRYAAANRIETQCMFADSFGSGGLRAKLRNRRLARLLNDPHFRWIGNHQINASESLAGSGFGGRRSSRGIGRRSSHLNSSDRKHTQAMQRRSRSSSQAWCLSQKASATACTLRHCCARSNSMCVSSWREMCRTMRFVSVRTNLG